MKVMRCLLNAVGLFTGIALSASTATNITTNVSNQQNSTLPHSRTSSISLPANTSVPFSSDDAVCSARTVNYITHTLPQQCLRTDWTRSRTVQVQTEATSTRSELAIASDDPSGQALRASSGVDDGGSVNTDSISDSRASSQMHSLDTEATSTQSESVNTSATTSSTPDSTSSNAETTSDAETDPLLDESNFLSFEDWKKQNLAKAGQSGENLGSKHHMESGRRTPDIHDFDTIGDENEIDIDFSGFSGVAQPRKASSDNADPSSTTDGDDVVKSSHASQALRPKDAGKTCKERTNYASFDCAATVLKSNSECKSASSVLIENKDSYMLNKCSAKDKHFIVELCNDILVDTIVLANFEFFSSIFRHFKVSVSDRYPVKSEKWRDLGSFEARNTREVQAFLIENPLIWARYLRIDFVTHYGSEYYCPVSLLRVHGTTMMEEFRNQEELARDETPDGIADVVSETAQSESESLQVTHETTETASTESDIAGLLNTSGSISIHSSDLPVSKPSDAVTPKTTTMTVTMKTRDVVRELIIMSAEPNDSEADPGSAMNSIASTLVEAMSSISTTQSSSVIESIGTSTTEIATSMMNVSTSAMTSQTTSNNSSSFNSTISQENPTSTQNTSINSSTSIANTSTSSSTMSANGTARESSLQSPQNTTTTKAATAASAAAQPQPSTQESFFKSISKRLQQLESNSTLSMQYIEESSRILREAFSKVEKRQIGATTAFLSNLNDTVMAELTGFRQAYDQLWQSTVIELEGQRVQHHREMTALSSRLTLVVDELVWQKRMGIVQSMLLLLCLALVLFVRGGNNSLEFPFMQQVMSRSQAAFRSNPGSDQNSPASGRSPVSLFRRKVWTAEPDSASPRPGSADEGNAYSGLETPRSLDEHDLQNIPEITYTTHDEYSGSDSDSDSLE